MFALQHNKNLLGEKMEIKSTGAKKHVKELVKQFETMKQPEEKSKSHVQQMVQKFDKLEEENKDQYIQMKKPGHCTLI